MKVWPKPFLAAATLSLSGCAGGSFCEVYQEVRIAPQAALDLTRADRDAAERIYANNAAYASCRQQ